MKLKSMTEFVLEQDKIMSKEMNLSYFHYNVGDSFDKIVLYAKLLKQPLTLGMFVPVDEEGNVLKNPHARDEDAGTEKEELQIEFNNALEKVLFEGVKIKHRENYFILEDEDGTWIRVVKNNTPLKVEYLLKMSSVELTTSGLKEIGL